MYLRQLRKMVGRGMGHLSHSDLHMPRITRDECDVQSIVKLLEDDWTNRFHPNESEFVSISTQMKVSSSAFRQVPLMHTKLA